VNKAVPAERYVLDASAIMCLIRNEPGAEAVKSALPRSSVSAVNLGEVVAKMSELGMDEALIAKVLDPLQLDIRPFESDLAHASGMLRQLTRALGLSLGDRACLALAAKLGATALTTDRIWMQLHGIASIAIAR
jgi:PIN domain nuclease of toxin-antitoxin system